MGRKPMSRTYTSLLAHVTFSTKLRRPLITPALEERLLPYLGGIVRQTGGSLLAANTVPDHVHLLIHLPPTIAMSVAMRDVKACSSKWIHESFPGTRQFTWQRGFAAFAVSRSGVPAVTRYIERQKEHHRKVTFQDELVKLLQKHAIEFDHRYLWV
jgi:putative transposase